MANRPSEHILPLQPASEDIWDKKYRLKDKKGVPLDQTIQDTYRRVARALADVEKTPELREKWYRQFLRALEQGAIPAGRITSNAGAQEHKPETSLINCLAGDTPVLTRQGIRPIAELVGNPVEVLNRLGKWVPVQFQSYGRRRTVEASFRNAARKGDSVLKVRSTLNHRWILQEGQVITTEYWASREKIARGHAVVPNVFAPRPERNGEYDRGVFHGLMYGDGSRHADTQHYVLDLVGEKQELAVWAEKQLEKPGLLTFYGSDRATGPQGLRWNFTDHHTDWKQLPGSDESPSYVLGFIAGLLATDGSVSRLALGSCNVTVFGRPEVIDYVARMAPTVGIVAYEPSLFSSKGSVNSYGERRVDLCRVTLNAASLDSQDVLRSQHKEAFSTTDYGRSTVSKWEMVGLTPNSEREEEVFCCQEPETGSFVLASGLLTGNCTVSAHIRDSMDDILEKVHEAGLTLKAGCGIGYSFSTLRPKGAFVAGAGAYTSGPMSFMDIYDKTCFTVASAGGRRGAQMGTFDVSHPDVRDFIRAKREDGRLRQFNLSLLITDDFIKAVEANQEWALVFPIHAKEAEDIDLADATQVVWREWPITKGYITRESDGKVACKVYDRINARRLWDMIMTSTYDFAEPGFILIDRVNEMNNNWWCENIQATNPCGEQPLPEYGSCLLGSINLTRFVRNPFTAEAYFDWEAYAEVVRVFTRMLDNVVELNGLPLERQREEITTKRRHGMGFLGLGSALTMLRESYGNQKSVEFTEQVSKVMAVEGWKMALELAKEKGPAPLLEREFEVTSEMLSKRPEMVRDGWKVGAKIKGAMLHARYSRYMQRIAEVEPDLVKELEVVGARFTHHSSIAPTGTISLSLANNASNGIEPSFAHHYSRNVIREGKKSKEKVEVYSYELLAYRELVNPKAMPFSEDQEAKLPAYFISADEVTPNQHVDIQAAAQKWIDSSISKTANVPTDFPYEKFKDIYLYAYHKGLKGCTTFRFNPAAFQGVLVKEKDLENTIYQFTLEDGSTVEFRGNEEVEYDGEKHTAANLFDALKEGYYGKF